MGTSCVLRYTQAAPIAFPTRGARQRVGRFHFCRNGEKVKRYLSDFFCLTKFPLSITFPLRMSHPLPAKSVQQVKPLAVLTKDDPRRRFIRVFTSVKP